jgi:quercetin dioxygenase-like cupin family protein
MRAYGSFLKNTVAATVAGTAFLLLAGFGTISDTEIAGTSRTLAGDIQWHQVAPGRFLAAVKGDFKTGAHVKLIKFDAGVKTPPHKHSYSYVGVIMTGRMRHFEPGKPDTETILTPGSYYEIGAEVAHISECLEGEVCVFVTQSDGAFDLKPAK